jgi:Zn finger protein HypA/HybF involved in hydrogenase expression
MSSIGNLSIVRPNLGQFAFGYIADFSGCKAIAEMSFESAEWNVQCQHARLRSGISDLSWNADCKECNLAHVRLAF